MAERLAAAVCAAALVLAPAGRGHAQGSGAGVGAAAEVVLSALGLVGVPYRYGGSDPASGLDCSGLVQYAVRAATGLLLPRQTEAISRSGIAVDAAQLQPGDLVFFNTLGRPFSHVGVYLGDQQFVHAPARRGQVRIEPLTHAYWKDRFNGARRLNGLAAEGTRSGTSAMGAALGHGAAIANPDDPFGLERP
jgi:cell wall-associated NlpC family hydrolase